MLNINHLHTMWYIEINYNLYQSRKTKEVLCGILNLSKKFVYHFTTETLYKECRFVTENALLFSVLYISETTYTQYSNLSLYATRETKLWTLCITHVIKKRDNYLSKIVPWRLPTRVFMFNNFYIAHLLFLLKGFN